MERRRWKVLEAHENVAYPKSAHRFDRAKGEKVGNNGAGEAGRDGEARRSDVKLRNLDHPMRNVEPWKGFTSAGATARLAAGGPLWWLVEDQ